MKINNMVVEPRCLSHGSRDQMGFSCTICHSAASRASENWSREQTGCLAPLWVWGGDRAFCDCNMATSITSLRRVMGHARPGNGIGIWHSLLHAWTGSHFNFIISCLFLFQLFAEKWLRNTVDGLTAVNEIPSCPWTTTVWPTSHPELTTIIPRSTDLPEAFQRAAITHVWLLATCTGTCGP